MAHISAINATIIRPLAVPTAATIPLAPLAGRILLATIFILSGLTKFTDWQGTANYMTSHGVPLVPVLLPLAAIVELAGGLAVLLGSQGRLAALTLFMFLIPTTLVFHGFWAYEGAEYTNQLHHFLKNLAIMGGLALIIGLGPGPVSVDEWRRRRRT
jgi:putative oxidoreductase